MMGSMISKTRKSLLLLIASALMFLILIISGFTMVNKHQTEKPLQCSQNDVNQQLQSLTIQLQALKQSIDTKPVANDFLKIDEGIKNAMGSIQKLHSSNQSTIQQLFNELKESVNPEIKAMQADIHALNIKQNPLNYLPVSTLPFKVVSIDSLQQTGVASIAYDHKIWPLEKGDSLAGWKAIKVDFHKQSIEFVNQTQSHVLVKLEQRDE